MTTNHHTRDKDPEKTFDLPPYGSRNPDPITDTPGSHPIEAGIGAAVGGAASGFAVGVATGPVGAVAGAVAGAIAGGYAGKGIGELIDPTTEDNWLREYFGRQSAKGNVRPGDTADTYRPAYRHGVAAGAGGYRSFEEAEADLRAAWADHGKDTGLTWDQARPYVRDAYTRAMERRMKAI